MSKEIVLKLDEQETLISWVEASHECEIQTFSPGLKRKLEAFARKYPELCHLIHGSDEVGRGGVIYRVDRRKLSINFKEPSDGAGWTDERREAKRQLMNKINAEKHDKLSRKSSLESLENFG